MNRPLGMLKSTCCDIKLEMKSKFMLRYSINMEYVQIPAKLSNLKTALALRRTSASPLTDRMRAAASALPRELWRSALMLSLRLSIR